MPVEWLATQMPRLLRELPLTKKGLSSLQYTQSRAVGYEADATGEKAEERAAAIAEGKISAEEFDAQLEQTPLAFYETLAAQIEASQEAMRRLEKPFMNVCVWAAMVQPARGDAWQACWRCHRATSQTSPIWTRALTNSSSTYLVKAGLPRVCLPS